MKAVIFSSWSCFQSCNPILSPKPMLPLGNKPLIPSWMAVQFRKIDQNNTCVSYPSQKYRGLFWRCGSRFGIEIKYVDPQRKRQLATAGQTKDSTTIGTTFDVSACDSVWIFLLMLWLTTIKAQCLYFLKTTPK